MGAGEGDAYPLAGGEFFFFAGAATAAGECAVEGGRGNADERVGEVRGRGSGGVKVEVVAGERRIVVGLEWISQDEGRDPEVSILAQ